VPTFGAGKKRKYAMKYLGFSAAVAAILLTSACSMTGKNSTEQLTDQQLQSMVKTKLQADASISRLNLGVDANAEHRAVELTGTAYTQRQRTRAVDLAKGVREGIAVEDKIEVKPYEVPRDLFDDEMMQEAKADATKMSDKMGETMDDAWIHTKIVGKLISDATTPERKINVDVMDKVVTLRGTVPTLEAKEQAESIAKGVEGVKNVNNRLMVRG
jgi:hyperosmotically inducible periplasmic protein